MATDSPDKMIRRYVSAYKPEPGTSLAHKIADFLHGLATAVPHHGVRHADLARAVLGLDKSPTEGSLVAKQVRSCIGRAREIMRSKYGCSIHCANGESRATVDATDQARTRVDSSARRLAACHRTLVVEAALAPSEKIDDPVYKEWMTKGVQPLLTMMNVDDRIDKLLPPKRK